MASVRKHHGQWYCIYRDRVAGKKSATWEACGKRRELAEKRKCEVERMLEVGLSPSIEQMSFSEAWDLWIRSKKRSKNTLRDYLSTYRVHFEPFFVKARNDMRIKAITANTIDDFTVDRREHGLDVHGKPTGISDARLGHILITLQAFLNWDKSRGYTGQPPEKSWFAIPKGIGRKVKPLSMKEVEALIVATPEHYRAFVAFLAYTGARLSEATALRWEDFDADLKEVWIRRKWELDELRNYTKTESDRRAPILPRLRELLVASREACGNPKLGWVFTNPSGGPINTNNFRARIFRVALARAGLDETRRIHDLRHQCASLMHAAGVPLRDVMDSLGWRVMSTLLRYTHPTENLDRISERLQAKWDAEMGKDDTDDDEPDGACVT